MRVAFIIPQGTDYISAIRPDALITRRWANLLGLRSQSATIVVYRAFDSPLNGRCGDNYFSFANTGVEKHTQ